MGHLNRYEVSEYNKGHKAAIAYIAMILDASLFKGQSLQLLQEKAQSISEIKTSYMLGFGNAVNDYLNA